MEILKFGLTGLLKFDFYAMTKFGACGTTKFLKSRIGLLTGLQRFDFFYNDTMTKLDPEKQQNFDEIVEGVLGVRV